MTTKELEEKILDKLLVLIEELKEQLELTKNDRDERELKARDLMKKLKEIEKAYIEFEKSETEYNKKLGFLDGLIMRR